MTSTPPPLPGEQPGASPTSPGSGPDTTAASPLRRWAPLLVVIGAVLLLVVVALVSPFSTTPPDIRVANALVGAGADPAGAYLVLDNAGGSDDLVAVTSPAGSVTAPLEITEDIMPGVVSLPHGWGHDLPGARLEVAARRPGVNSNVLAGDAIDPLSGNAVLNGIPVEVTPAE